MHQVGTASARLGLSKFTQIDSLVLQDCRAALPWPLSGVHSAGLTEAAPVRPSFPGVQLVVSVQHLPLAAVPGPLHVLGDLT